MEHDTLLHKHCCAWVSAVARVGASVVRTSVCQARAGMRASVSMSPQPRGGGDGRVCIARVANMWQSVCVRGHRARTGARLCEHVAVSEPQPEDAVVGAVGDEQRVDVKGDACGSDGCDESAWVGRAMAWMGRHNRTVYNGSGRFRTIKYG
eukprot:2282517-Pleurochrysis_carterae.AAC.1